MTDERGRCFEKWNKQTGNGEKGKGKAIFKFCSQAVAASHGITKKWLVVRQGEGKKLFCS